MAHDVHRRFQKWEREGVLDRILAAIARDLRDRGKLDLTEVLSTAVTPAQKKGRSCWENSPRQGDHLIGDRAYDSNPLDAELAEMGIGMIAPHDPTRKHKTQDGRPLRRYRRRWHIERLFAWLQCSRRLITRFEHKSENFLAFVKLRCIVILLRRL